MFTECAVLAGTPLITTESLHINITDNAYENLHINIMESNAR